MTTSLPPVADTEAQPNVRWQSTVLALAKAAGVLAGPGFVLAYAFGLISVAKFLGRYGLQPTELLRSRYLSIGLSAIVLTIPTVLCLEWAVSLARNYREAPEKKWFNRLRSVPFALFCGLMTFGTWIFWSGFLASFQPQSFPTVLVRYAFTLSIAATVASLMPFLFDGHDRVWTIIMSVMWSLLVCTILSSILQYMPPWAGGYATPPVKVITLEPALQDYLSGTVVVVEATSDRYVFWDTTEDRLIEIPSQYVLAILADPESSDGSADE